ncbi:MAG TPA: DUF1501 domain-containing protein [Planctomycetaceae bacterium]|nr:DUF1501 domain-containing protein [Planctomycetaceae bacterium]
MLNRRRCLQVGGLNLLGLTLSDLFRLRAATAAAAPAAKHRGNSCVFLFLFGGPSHIDLWDMKPKAPAEIRGEFSPVATNVPGIDICEQLPRLAQTIDKLCLLRSMTHRMNVHGPACSEIFSGRPYFGPPVTDQARPEDWPSLSSMTMRYGRSPLGLPPAVVLPWYLQFPGQSLRIAGQTGGRMGEQFNPMLLEADSGRFQLGGLALHDEVPWPRLTRRRQLLGSLESQGPAHQTAKIAEFERQSARVYSLLENRVDDVLNIDREPPSIRESYGPTAVGQSLLMARRLVEAGVPLVSVNWEDETKTDGVNTCWDTHQQNFAKLKTLLCPIFDRVFPAFLNDLAQRGLLESTLVVAVGEFGRTPRLGQFTQSSNTKAGGRDHWPHAFTALVAGGGVRGGQVYGATTPTGGYVADQPVTPADLTATILHHLGIDPAIEYDDGFQRMRQRLSEGLVVEELS